MGDIHLWSCVPDMQSNLKFPRPTGASHVIWLSSTNQFKRKRYLKIIVIARGRADNHLGSKSLYKLVICCKFLSFNNSPTSFPVYKIHSRPILILRQICSRSTEGHHLYDFCRARVIDASCQVARCSNF